MDILQFLRVKLTDNVTVTWEITPSKAKHPYIQESIDEAELADAQRFSIEVSGVNDEGRPRSFFHRRPFTQRDWSEKRKTRNNRGIAIVLS